MQPLKHDLPQRRRPQDRGDRQADVRQAVDRLIDRLGPRRRSRHPYLAEIADRSFWHTASFTSWYFDVGCEQLVRGQPAGARGPAYRDLQFNRAKIEAAWPKETRPGHPDRISAITAFNRILRESQRRTAFEQHPERFKLDADYLNSVSPGYRSRERLVKELRQDLRDRLRAGNISASGRPVRHGPGGDLPMRPIARGHTGDDEADQRALGFQRQLLAMFRRQ